MSTQRTGGTMYLLAIIVFIALMTLLFSDQIERNHNPNQSVLSDRASDGSLRIRLERNRAGHYIATGAINGVTVDCMVDTGATNVAVSAAVAEAAGLQRGPSVQTMTANGPATAYATVIDELRLGELVLRDIPAAIVPALEEGQVLLGMSYLERIDFSQRGEELILEPRQPHMP